MTELRRDAAVYDFSKQLSALSDRFIMKPTGRTRSITAMPFVSNDLAEELQFQTGDFYDHVHNTSRGTEKIGSYLFRKLEQSSIGRRQR